MNGMYVGALLSAQHPLSPPMEWGAEAQLMSVSVSLLASRAWIAYPPETENFLP